MGFHRYHLVLAISLFSRINFLFAQDCSSSLTSIYGLSEIDESGDVLISSAQGEIYVAGTKEDSTLLVKADLSGEILWSNTIDIVPGYEYPNGMILDSEGMLAVVGTRGTNGTGQGIYLIRYDPITQSALWVKEYQWSPNDFAFSIIQKENGNYVLSVQPTFTTPNHEDAIIFEVNRFDGTLVSELSRSYSLGGTETLFEIAYHDGFIYGVGRYKDGGFVSSFRNTLVKLDTSSGQQIWAKFGHVESNATARLYGSDLIIDDQSIVSIYSGDPDGTSTTNTSMYLQKTDLDGNLVWLREYDIPGVTDLGLDVIRVEDGYVILAHKRAEGEYVVFKTNLIGESLWGKSYIFESLSNPLGIIQGSSLLAVAGDYIFFTGHGRNEIGNQDLILARLDLAGNAVSSCIQTIEINILDRLVANPVIYESQPLEDLPVFSETNRDPFIRQTHLLSACEANSFIITEVQKNICHDESYEGYTISGVYSDTFSLANGCDSIRILELTSLGCSPVIHYNLNACVAYMNDGTNMDYSEFTPSYPELACAAVAAGILHRTNAPENKHSCTPGVNNSDAMCVSSYPSCTYNAGHEASVIIEFSVDPLEDSLFTFSKIEFYEKAPSSYVWINGPTGLNNYPLLFGIRILKNGAEIYRNESVPTNLNWALQSFNFIDNELFKVEGLTTFRIELLPYCPIGNGAAVSAWDIDEIRIYAACAPLDLDVVLGQIKSKDGRAMNGTQVWMAKDPWFSEYTYSITEGTGDYMFSKVKPEVVFLKSHKKDDVLNGVSTIDLIYIQKHLLGVSELNSLAEFVAADINNSYTLTAIDLLELRKVILGINDEFPQNASWRFGPANQDWQNHDISSFREMEEVNMLNDTHTIDFVGIKIGDLNGDVQLLGNPTPVKPRNQENLMLMMEELEISKGSTASIDIKSGSNMDIIGMQCAFDLKDIEVNSIKPGRLNLKNSNFHIDGDVLRISWNDDAVKLDDNSVLFTVVVKAKSNTHPGKAFKLNTDILKAECYSPDLRTSDILLNLKSGNNISFDKQIFEIAPNPVHQEAKISFNLQREEFVTLNFYDMAGSLIYFIEKHYTAGHHIEHVAAHQLGSHKGIMYCQMISGSASGVKKFILAE